MILLCLHSTNIIRKNGILTFINNLIDSMSDDIEFIILSDSNVDGYKYNNIIYTNIDDIDINKVRFIITNDVYGLSTTKDINVKKYHFTHHPSLLKKNMDMFEIQYIINNNVNILTQSEELKRLMLKKYDTINEIHVLPQPYIIRNNDDTMINRDVLIISSDEERKNYDIMLEALSKTDYSITILCNQSTHIRKYLEKHNVRNFRIFENYPNSRITQMIKGHKLLLHMSKLEVYPYSILESLFFIPVVLNCETEWAGSFGSFSSCIMCKNDVENILNAMSKIMNNNINITDYNNYICNFRKEWITFYDKHSFNICT